jgi:hypothetical protein
MAFLSFREASWTSPRFPAKPFDVRCRNKVGLQSCFVRIAQSTSSEL